MNKITKYALRSAIKVPWVSRILVGAVVGISVGFGNYHLIDNLYYRPHIEVLEHDRRARDIFAEIRDIYFNPKYDAKRNKTDITFYNFSPDKVLERLEETKRIIERDRDFLVSGGYINNVTWKTEGWFASKFEGLQESQLDLAVENVQTFLPYWPQNREKWEVYLYAGDTKRPSGRYFEDIHSFYKSADKAKTDVNWNIFRAIWIRDSALILTGIFSTGLAILLYPFMNSFLRNRYKKIIANERLKQNLEKLKTI